MSEEVKIKISQPMFEVGELEVFDNNIHSIVEKYSKIQLHEKEQILTQRIIIKQEEEIERLNNIIEEVREYLTDEGVCILNKGKKENERLVWTWENYYDLLEILKGSEKE